MNLGQTLAYAAVGVHMFFMLVSVIFWKVENPNLPMGLSTKYSDRGSMQNAMGNFGHNSDGSPTANCVPGCTAETTPCEAGCSDAVVLIKFEMVRRSDEVAIATLNGLVQSVAALLAIFALLSFKTQITFKKGSADEKELIAFTSLMFGFGLPMIQLVMATGPMNYCAWVGTSALNDHDRAIFLQPPIDPARPPSWSNFGHSDWHMLHMTVSIVETLFMWMDTLAALLLSVGFGLLSTVAEERAKAIVTRKQTLVGYATAVIFGLIAVAGVLREVSWVASKVIPPLSLLGVFVAMPAWFVMLGIGLGKVDSIESMNAQMLGAPIGGGGDGAPP